MNRSTLVALLLLPLACSQDAPPGNGGVSGASGQASQAGAPTAGAGGAGAGGTAAGAGAGGAGAASGTSGSSGQGGRTDCAAVNVAGVSVALVDPYRYPPYAAEGCVLLYVAPVAGGGRELRRRDLVSGQEQVLAASDEEPRRPSFAGDVAAWEATVGGQTVVRVRTGGVTTTLSGDFVQATEPRATVDAVVFTAWKGDGSQADTDVLLYRVATGQLETIFGGPGQQRFADVSPTHVAASDFSEDPDGSFDENNSDLSDVVLHDRATGARVSRAQPGKQAFPLLGSAGEVVFLDWPGEHPEPKFEAYGVRVAGLIEGAPMRSLGDLKQTGLRVVRPDTRSGVVEWVTYEMSGAVLYRAELASGLLASPVAVPGQPYLFAPVLAGGFSLAAHSADDSAIAASLLVLP